MYLFFFFFNDPAPTEIYPLPLHDALPISSATKSGLPKSTPAVCPNCRSCFQRITPYPSSRKIRTTKPSPSRTDRKSTRLNSSHLVISYAVFCLKKKKDSINHSIVHSKNTS